MNRNTIVALSMAAVLGTTGGVALAVQQSRSGNDTSTASARPSSSATPAPTKTPTLSGQDDSTNEPLLWANKHELHDGETTVDLDLQGDVQRVVRMDGGWVVAERTSPQEAAYALWWVSEKNKPVQVADVIGSWDADPTGRYVVGLAASGGIHVWTAATGAAHIWPVKPGGATYAGFMGQRVLISMDNNADGLGWQQFLWNPVTDKTSNPDGPAMGDQVTPGYPHLQVSPGGSYVTGTSGQEGAPDLGGSCLHLESTVLKKSRVSWNTCDWRLNSFENSFSPDGTRLLAVPSETDGFGPRTFGVIDASDSPRAMVALVDVPEWTMGAEWADNDHLYVVRASDGDMSSYLIDRCDFNGTCTRVAASKAYPAVGATR